MISVLIFTKDRACQLDLLLKSIVDNFNQIGELKILCKGSNESFCEGYSKVANKYRQFEWLVEEYLTEDIRKIVNSFTSDFSMCLVDDEIIINNHSVLPLLNKLKKDENVHCASIRMGTKLGDYCYTADLHCEKPELVLEDGVYKWDWTVGDKRVDWYYPSCINSHIYRTDFLKHWVSKIHFHTVNQLEGYLNLQREHFKSNMICLEIPKTINIANNLTQMGDNRHSNKKEFSLETLNQKYLDGYVIDHSPFYGMLNDTATFEKDYKFIKE